MAIRGKLSVDVQFSENTAAGSVSSLKTVALQSGNEYTTGKVLAVSGTAGTSAVTVAVAPSTYKDSAGNAVSLASVSWYAFRSSAAARCDEVAGDGACLSSGDQAAVSFASGGGTAGLSVYTLTGTASYTLVVYGT